MGFTVNSTVSNGDWIIVDAYSADISTSSQLVDTPAGHSALLKSITVDINETDKWFKVFNDADLQIGPVRPKGRIYHRSFETPLTFSGDIYVQTESNNQIHIIIAYRTKPNF